MSGVQIVSASRVLGATFLVAGTCVGGGMLALPVATATSGFFPSFAIMVICWLFMMVTGLLLVEANLWMEEGAHVMTMASRLLGLPGRCLSFCLYLFMAYASLVAYTAGGGLIFANATEKIFQFTVSRWEACTLFSVIFGLMLYLGTKAIGRINTLLVVGMIVAYVGLVSFGFEEIQGTLLSHIDWYRSCSAVPLLLTIFSYQMIVPSLTPYLKRDPTALRRSIILGTSIPFFIYTLWQAIVLGTVPLEGEFGLCYALTHGLAATESLRAFVQNPLLAIAAEFFAFFALVTSYLGIALGLYDFLADAMKIKKPGMSKRLLGLLVVAPSLFFALLYPKAFLFSLEISGGYGDAILNGMMPVAMVWVGRYKMRMEGPYRVFGGKKLLLCAFTVAVVVFIIQTISFL